MAFDPIEYLKEKEGSAFDPVAYLEEKESAIPEFDPVSYLQEKEGDRFDPTILEQTPQEELPSAFQQFNAQQEPATEFTQTPNGGWIEEKAPLPKPTLKETLDVAADENKQAEQMALRPVEEANEAIADFPLEKQTRLRELSNKYRQRSGIAATVGKLLGAGAEIAGKVVAPNPENQYNVDKINELQQMIGMVDKSQEATTVKRWARKFKNEKDPRFKAIINEINDPRKQNELIGILNAQKSYEKNKGFRAKSEAEAQKFLEPVKNIFDPADLKAYDLGERIEKLKLESNATKAALDRGDLGFVIDQAIADAERANDKEGLDKLIKTKEEFEAVARNTKRDKGNWLKQQWLGAMEMAMPMGKTGAKMAVPGVGQLWAGYEWARQGMGEIVTELTRAGVSLDKAREIGAIGGIAYAAVEQLQLKQITNISKSTVKKIILDKGINWLKEVGEEGLQRIITDMSVELGKRQEGLSDKEWSQVFKDVAGNAANEMWQAAPKMLFISGPSTLASLTMAGKDKTAPGTPPTEQVTAPPVEPTPGTPPAEQVVEPVAPAPIAPQELAPEETELLPPMEKQVETTKIKPEIKEEIFTPQEIQEIEREIEAGEEAKGKVVQEEKRPKVIIPEEILNPTAEFDKDIEAETDPGKKKRLEKARSRMEDNVIPGVFKFADAWDVAKHCEDNNIPCSIVRGDGRELKAWNTKNGNVHNKTDLEIQKIWGEVYQTKIKEAGGIMTREQGDEFLIVLPGYNKAESQELMEQIEVDALKVAGEMGLGDVPSAKRNYNGLPIGTGVIDWGIAETEKGKHGKVDRIADEEMNIRKTEKAIDKAVEKGYNVVIDPETERIIGYEPKQAVKKVEPRRKPRKEDAAAYAKRKQQEHKIERKEGVREVTKPEKQVVSEAKKPDKKPHLDYETNIVTEFEGHKRGRVKYTPEYNNLLDEEKFQALKDEKKIIDKRIAEKKALNDDVGIVGLNRIKTELNREQSKYSVAAINKARRKANQLDRYSETGKPTTIMTKEVQADAARIVSKYKGQKATKLNPLLKGNYTEKQLNTAIEAIEKGNKDGAAAQDIRKEIGGLLSEGVNEDQVQDIVENEQDDTSFDFGANKDKKISFKDTVPDDVRKRISPEIWDKTDIVIDKITDAGEMFSLGEGERASIEEAANGRYLITLSPKLTPAKQAAKLFHEFGHAGTANVLRTNKKIHERITSIYNSKPGKRLYEVVKYDYAEEYDVVSKKGDVIKSFDNPFEAEAFSRKNPESKVKVGKFNEDLIFTEWIAKNIELTMSDKGKSGIGYQVKKLIREFLINIGFDIDTVDDAIYSLIKQAKKVKEVKPGLIVKPLKSKKFSEESGDLFADTEFEKDEKKTRRALEKAEIKLRQQQRKGGRADVTDLPMFEGKEIEGTEQMKLFSKSLKKTQPNRKDLVALHNLSAENIIFADALGGLPAPSLAITKTDVPFSGMGEITLITDKKMVDPKYEEVFAADIYSPTAPATHYKKDSKQADKFSRELYEARRDYEGSSGHGYTEGTIEHPDRYGFIRYSMNDEAVQAMFLNEKGVKIKTRRTPVPIRDSFIVEHPAFKEYMETLDGNISSERMGDKALKAAIQKAVDDHFSPQADDKGLVVKMRTNSKKAYMENFFDETDGSPFFGTLDRLGRSYLERKANKTVFDRNYARDQIEKNIKPLMNEYGDWVKNKANDIFIEPHLKKGSKKLPVTLDNMVDIMLAQSLRGAEKNMVFGLGQARSRGAKKFKSIEDMQAEKERLVTREDVEKLKKPNEERFHELQSNVAEYYKWYDPGKLSFDAIDDFSKSMYDYYKGGKSAKNMERALAKNDYVNIPSHLIDDAVEFAEELRNLPTQYFEAKLQRGVKLNEFKGAVIPKNVDPKVKEILDRNKIEYSEYSPKRKNDRENAVKRFGKKKDVLFSKEIKPFYSPTERTISELKQEKGIVPQIKSMIKKGQLKKAEVEWAGLEEWLGENPKATKQEVLDFVRANEVIIEETEKESENALTEDEVIEQIVEEYSQSEERFETINQEDNFREMSQGDIESYVREYIDSDKSVFQEEINEIMEENQSELETKYSQYTIPGGTNYRELLLKMPEKKTKRYAEEDFEIVKAGDEYKIKLPDGSFYMDGWSRKYKHQVKEKVAEIAQEKTTANKNAKNYKSSHWEEPNVFAHTRLNDRITPDGDKVLFVEEIQSDWGKDAREKGVRARISKKEAKQQYNDYAQKMHDKYSFGWEDKVSTEEWHEEVRLRRQMAGDQKKVPDFPFKKNWHEFALKRILREAVEKGYDKIAWVTGEQTADRYDLSKQIETVIYDESDNTLVATDKDGNNVFGSPVPKDKVSDYIGKEPAKKLFEKEPNSDNERIISGQSLKVAPNWAKNLYDKMIPKFLNKYAKKWGAKTEVTKINNKDQLSLPITEEMRESISKGQPLFSKETKKSEDKRKIDGVPIDAFTGAERDAAEQFEAMKDVWFGEKDVRLQVLIPNEMDRFQQRIKKALGAKKYGAKAKLFDQAIQLHIDSKRSPGDYEKYKDKLTAEQKYIYKLSQELSPELKKIADDISKSYDEIGLEAMQHELIHNTIENYAGRIWDLSERKGKTFIESMRRFATKTGHSKQRKLNTIIEGWAIGLNLKVKGSTNNLKILKESIIKTAQDKRFLKALQKIKTIDGDLLVSNTQLTDYVKIDHPNFQSWKYVGKAIVDKKAGYHGRNSFITESGNAFEKVPLYAPAKQANNLNNILGVSKLKDTMGIKQATKYNAIFKSWILQSSFFHHLAYLRSYYLGTSGKTPSEMLAWTPFINSKGEHQAYRQGLKSIRDENPIIIQLVKNGLTLGVKQDWSEELLHEKTIIGKILDKNKATKAVKDKILDLREAQSNFLFGELGAGLKAKAAMIEYRNLIKKHPNMDTNQAAKMAANLINDDFGGLHLERIGRNPTIQHMFRLFALAPDWTESNVRSMVKMFTGTKESKDMYRKFWAGIVTKSVILTTAANLLLSIGADDEDDKFEKKLKRAWREGKFRWMDVDITRLYKALGGKTQDRKYFSIAGHFKDPAKFALHPLRSAQHKGSVLFKLIYEAISGVDWAGRRFTTAEELIGKDSKLGKKAAEDLRGKAVTWRQGKKGALGYEQLPSYILAQIRGLQPVQIQNLISYTSGEMEGFDALMNSLGLGISTTYGGEEGAYKKDRAEVRSVQKEYNYYIEKKDYAKATEIAREAGLLDVVAKRTGKKKKGQSKPNLKAIQSRINSLKKIKQRAEKRKDDITVEKIEEAILKQMQLYSEALERRQQK